MAKLLSKEEMDAIPCDAWHVHGNSSSMRIDSDEKFIEILKLNLPKINLPIAIGNTGYPVLTCAPGKTPARGWCLDEAKRFTAMIDEYWLFQRYTAGGPIMWGLKQEPANNIMYDELKDLILERIVKG